MWDLQVLALACVGCAFLWAVVSPVYRWRYRHVPGPVSLPLVGNLLNIQNETWHGFHVKCMNKFGSVFKIWHGATPHIVVAGPEAVKQVG